MVSYRKFFSICIMMAVLFFMFQFLQVYKESGNDYNINSHRGEPAPAGNGAWQADSADMGGLAGENGSYVLLIGDAEKGPGRTVSWWCTYTKRKLYVKKELDQSVSEEEILPELLLIDSGSVDVEEETGWLAEMAERGVPIIFCNLPSFSVIEENTELQELLGIKTAVAEQTQIQGVHLFSGLLLGEDVIYEAKTLAEEEKQDLELTVPWYITGKGTKTYMTGLLDPEAAEREAFPALIWRNSYRGAFVFAVNGDYLSDAAGLGILNGFVYELYPYELYPVINARNISVANYPGFAEENSGKLLEQYSRRPSAVQQDLIWPGISTVMERNKFKPTFFLMPQYDYQDDALPKADDMTFYLQQMRELDAEAGKTLEYREGITLAGKLSLDEAFWKEAAQGYRFGAYYAGNGLDEELEELLLKGGLGEDGTVVCPYDGEIPPVSWYNDGITLQSITVNAAEFTFSQDFRYKSLETALGYSNVLIDLKNVFWPSSEEDRWENFFDRVSRTVNTYCSSQDFSSTTMSESDAKVRSFLNLNYTEHNEQNRIILETEGAGEEAWFLLRTHGQDITGINGAGYQKLEENAFLIRVPSGKGASSKAEIELGKAKEELSFYFSEEN